MGLCLKMACLFFGTNNQEMLFFQVEFKSGDSFGGKSWVQKFEKREEAKLAVHCAITIKMCIQSGKET